LFNLPDSLIVTGPRKIPRIRSAIVGKRYRLAAAIVRPEGPSAYVRLRAHTYFDNQGNAAPLKRRWLLIKASSYSLADSLHPLLPGISNTRIGFAF
jgi:hypothetical protein